jgi:hypothetical protein
MAPVPAGAPAATAAWRSGQRGHRRRRAERAARRDDATYSHYALLRSIETLFHLPLLGHAGDPATAAIPALT